jgi:hypothetical protein
MANFVKNYSPFTNFAKASTVSGTQIAVGTSAQRNAAPQAGELRLNTTTNLLEVYKNGAFENIAIAGFSTVTKTTVAFGDGSTTSFASFFATAPTDENSVIVVVGNVVQEPTAAYTISGTSITFTSPPPTTHRIYALAGFDSTSAS